MALIAKAAPTAVLTNVWAVWMALFYQGTPALSVTLNASHVQDLLQAALSAKEGST